MFVHALFCACAPHPPAPGGVQLSQSELMTTYSLFLCILFTDLMCIYFWNTVSVTAFLSVKKITYYWFSYSVFHLSWTASVSINRCIIRHSVICNQLLWCFFFRLARHLQKEVQSSNSHDFTEEQKVSVMMTDSCQSLYDA